MHSLPNCFYERKVRTDISGAGPGWRSPTCEASGDSPCHPGEGRGHSSSVPLGTAAGQSTERSWGSGQRAAPWDRSRSTSLRARPRRAGQPGPRRRLRARPPPPRAGGSTGASPEPRWCVCPGGPRGGLVRGRLEPRPQFPPPRGARRPRVPPCVTASARTQVWAEGPLTSSSRRSDHSRKQRPWYSQGSWRKTVSGRIN